MISVRYLVIILLFSRWCHADSGKTQSIPLGYTHQADSIRRAGLQFKRAGEFRKALSHYHLALKHFDDLELLTEVADCHNKVGVAYFRLDEFDSALYHYYRSEQLNDSLQHKSGLLKNYVNLSNYFANEHDYVNAITFNNKGQKLALELDNVPLLATLYENIGIIYVDPKKPLVDIETAKYYFQQSLLIFLDFKHKPGVAGAYQNLGLVYEHLNQFDSAYQYYIQSLELQRELDNKIEMSALFLNLGNLTKENGQLNSALDFYNQGLELAQTYDSKGLVHSISGNIALVYTELGDFRKALEMEKLNHQYNDSLFNETKSQQIAELNAKYETEKKEKELAQARIDIERKTAERDGYLLALAVFLALAIVLVLIYQQRQQAIKALGAKEKDLYNRRVDELLLEQELKSLNAIMDGQEAERKRISRELHDRVGSLLTAMKFSFEEVNNSNSKTKNLLDEALEETRNLSHSLASGVLDKFGIVAAISDLINIIETDRNIIVEFKYEGFEKRINGKIEIDIYRILQELISNTLKHSFAKKIVIALTQSDRNIRLEYFDNGVGFDLGKNIGGIGLKNIEARSKKYNGNLNIESRSGKGMKLLLNIEIFEDETIIAG